MRYFLAILVLLLIHCFYSASVAQENDDSVDLLQLPLFYSEVNPENPIGIFSLDLPFYFPAKNPAKNQISIAYSMGNIWHPQARFYYPQDLSLQQSEELKGIYTTWRPVYFLLMDIDAKEKMFQSDGVLQHLKLTYTNTWTSKHSLIFNFNIHQLSGGQSWLNYLVSDKFIEAFHSKFAIEDNYGRRLFPFNRATIQFDDEYGNSFKKEKGDVFLSVIDAHYYRQLYHFKNKKWHFDSQLGMHLSIPLNQFHPYIIPGASFGLRSDFRLGAKSSFTYAVDGGITDQTFWKVGEGVHAIDRKYRKVFRNFLSFNMLSKKKNTTVIGILVNYQGALMNGYSFTADQSGFDEIGIGFLQEGDVWEGEIISKEFYLAKLNPEALYYYSVKTYLFLGFHKNGKELNISLGEDLFTLNNAPDVQISIQYRFSPFGKKKK